MWAAEQCARSVPLGQVLPPIPRRRHQECPRGIQATRNGIQLESPNDRAGARGEGRQFFHACSSSCEAAHAQGAQPDDQRRGLRARTRAPYRALARALAPAARGRARRSASGFPAAARDLFATATQARRPLEYRATPRGSARRTPRGPGGARHLASKARPRRTGGLPDGARAAASRPSRQA